MSEAPATDLVAQPAMQCKQRHADDHTCNQTHKHGEATLQIKMRRARDKESQASTDTSSRKHQAEQRNASKDMTYKGTNLSKQDVLCTGKYN